MAHNLEIVDGAASFVYVGQPAWHKLGNRLTGNPTPQIMAIAANATFEVRKCPLFAPVDFDFTSDETFDSRTYTGRWMTDGAANVVRTDTGKTLSVIPQNAKDWHVFQNAEAFAFFDEYVKKGHMTMETAGVLDGGRIVWCLARIKRAFAAIKGDLVESFILITVSHKWGLGHHVRFTPVRVVCQNTLSRALNGKDVGGKLSIDHSKRFDVSGVKTALGLADKMMDDYEEKAKFLAKVPYVKENVSIYMDEIFPVWKTKAKPLVKRDGTVRMPQQKERTQGAEMALANLETQPGAEFAPGTWWNAFNAATFYTNHVSGKTDNTRVRSLWMGENAKLNSRALDRAVEMANMDR